MAIFASTTTSGYSDPVKALSIKALEQRLKEQQAQMAAQQPDAAMMGTIPGGIGHVLSQVGDRMAQGRNEQALASQRDVLAKAVAGYDPTSGAPPPPVIASVAPDMYKDMLQTWAENRRAQQADARAREMQKESLAHTSAESGLTREQQATLAANADARAREMQKESLGHAETLAEKTDRRAREMQQESLSAAETTASRSDERARTLQKERLEAEAALKQKELEAAAATRASDPKRAEAIEASETNYRKGLSHIENLEEATKILQHPNGIYTGAAQSLAPVAGGIPGVGGMIVDKEKAQRTSRYNTLVGEDAIRDMATTLKGSSTNFEMQKFEKMKNDPNISDAARATQLQKAVTAARADLEAQAKTAKAIGGDTGRVDRAMSASKGATSAADPAAAQAAIDGGAPFDAVAARFKSKGGDPSVLKPKGP